MRATTPVYCRAMSRRILITGGAGFIGSHLADAYLAQGYEVGILDNLNTGHRAYLPSEAAFWQADLRDRDALQRVVTEFAPDTISHHAAQNNVRRSLEDPQADADINLMGSLHLLEAALKAGTRQMVFSSSGGAIYGDGVERPTTEDALRQPTSPYGIAKLAFEEYLRVLGGLHDLTVTVLRYGNIYGPRQIVEGEAGVIAIFTKSLLAGQRPVIYGTGDNRRDYLFVDDCVRANILATDRGEAGIFNLGTGRETTVREIYALVAGAIDSDLEPQQGPERPGEVIASSLDATKFREAYGWSPNIVLEEGIVRTVEWFRSGAER